MDAISFVLGVQARQLRGFILKDLIHGANSGRMLADKASVSAFFRESDDSDEEMVMTRT